MNRILSPLHSPTKSWANGCRKLEGLAAYAKDLEEYAQQALLDGRSLPGWKLVQGRSTRKWTDQDAAFQQMEHDGIDEAMLYTRTPISLTAAEKMIGKKKFADTMSAFITRAPGVPKLAAASDPAPCLQPLRGLHARGGLTMNANEVIIPCRLSYANTWEPKQVNGTGDPKYSCCLLIKKSDTAAIAKLKAAIEAVKKDPRALARWAAQCPRT